jgi:spore coat protein CotH
MGKNAQYYADRIQAREAAYKYLNNPFPEDTRKARFYAKEKVHKRAMDSYFDDMEEIYGSIGIKKVSLITSRIRSLRSETKKKCNIHEQTLEQTDFSNASRTHYSWSV